MIFMFTANGFLFYYLLLVLLKGIFFLSFDVGAPTEVDINIMVRSMGPISEVDMVNLP